jgi:hypothetical protein
VNAEVHPAVSAQAGMRIMAARKDASIVLTVHSPQGMLGEVALDAREVADWARTLSSYLLEHPPMRGAVTPAFRLESSIGHYVKVNDLGLSTPRILIELAVRGKWWQELKLEELDFVVWLRQLSAYLGNS